MHHIFFYCPKCRQQMEADYDMAGSGMECPSCGESMVIPELTVHPDAGGPQVNFDCLVCGQNIDAPANAVGVEVTCPNCQNVLLVPGLVDVEEPGIQPADAEQSQQVEDEKKASTSRIDVPERDGLPQRQIRSMKIKRPTGSQTSTVTVQPGGGPKGREAGGEPGTRRGFRGLFRR